MANTWPFEPYKIDTYFNKPTSYGTHEGLDFNGIKGGNTDCGYELKAICSGVVENVSTSTGNYGKLLVIKTTFNGVDYWVRYAHCQDILVQRGNTIREGEVVARMGSTGNSTACHLHLDILKRYPPNWRFYTQTVDDWFVDPIWFIKNYNEVSMPSDDGTNWKEKYDKLEHEFSLEQQRVVDCRADRSLLEQENQRIRDEMVKLRDDMTVRVTAAETGLKAEKEAHQDKVKFLSSQLNTTQNWSEIQAQVVELVGVEDLLSKERKAHQETKESLGESNLREKALEAEIDRLNGELKKAKGLGDATTADLIEELIARLKRLLRRNK